MAEDDNAEAGPSKRARRVNNRDESSKDVRTEVLRALTREVQEMSSELHTMREKAAEDQVEIVSAVCMLGKGFNTFLIDVLEPMR